jgi:hypothetical protein
MDEQTKMFYFMFFMIIWVFGWMFFGTDKYIEIEVREGYCSIEEKPCYEEIPILVYEPHAIWMQNNMWLFGVGMVVSFFIWLKSSYNPCNTKNEVRK